MIGLDAYLSGVEDSTTDFSFPIGTFNLTKRDGTNSYYSVSAAFSEALLAAFEARPNGKVHVRKITDGVPAAWEYFNVNAVNYALGPGSKSITVSGYRQDTNASPASVTVPAALVTGEGRDSQGRLLLDVVPWALDVTPGDTLAYAGSNYTLVMATYQASPAKHTLKITLEEIIP